MLQGYTEIDLLQMLQAYLSDNQAYGWLSLTLCKTAKTLRFGGFFFFATILLQILESKLRMSKPEKYEYFPFTPPILRDRGGDIRKRWYIEFYAFDTDAMKLKRKLLYIPKTLSAKQRKAWAKPRLEEVRLMLEGGYTIASKKKKAKDVALTAQVTIIEAIDYIIKTVANEFAPDTVRSYKNIMAAFCKYLTDQKLHKCMPYEIEASHTTMYLDQMAAAGKTNKTINNHLTVLRAVSNKMIARGWNNEIGKGGKMRKTVEARNLAFTDEQRALLLNFFIKESQGMYVVLLLMYYAFIRPAEICRLKVGDVDLANGVITMAGSQTKNSLNANVPIPKPLHDALSSYIEGHPKTHYLVGSGIRPNKIATQTKRMWEAHRNALDVLNIKEEGLSLYSWKDTGACNAYRAGIDIKTLQRMLRHSSVAMTEIYLRSLGESVKDNIEGKEW